MVTTIRQIRNIRTNWFNDLDTIRTKSQYLQDPQIPPIKKHKTSCPLYPHEHGSMKTMGTEEKEFLEVKTKQPYQLVNSI